MVSDIMTLLSPERTLFVQELESKKRVFDTLAKLLSYKQSQLTQDEIFDYLIDREKLGSTTLGGGKPYREHGFLLLNLTLPYYCLRKGSLSIVLINSL